MTLSELRNISPPFALVQLSDDEYQYAWIADFWDGAISGLLLLNAQFHWFEMIQENENEDWKEVDWYRRYAVVELSSEQLKKQLEVHRDFQRYVSTSWDRIVFEDTPASVNGQMEKFYDKHAEYARSRPFENNRVVAWFET